MREKDLSKLVEKLNSKTESDLIQKKTLSKDVELAILWPKKPEETDETTSCFNSQKYFLIKSENNKYVAIVFDMGNDLHWFVSENQRKKGYLSKALQNTIIPYLLSIKGRQRITINESQIGKENYIASKKVAENLGFLNINDIEFILENDKDEYHEKYLEILNYENSYKISKERMLILSKKVNFAFRYLTLIQSELEQNFGNLDYSDGFKEIIEPLRYQKDEIMYYWHEKNRNE